MSDDNYTPQPEEQVQETPEQAAPQQAPQDLSEAFKALRANEQAATASSVEPEQPSPEPEQQQEAGQPEQYEYPEDVQYDGGSSAGGPSAVMQDFDYNAYGAGILKEINTYAQQQVTQLFKDNGIQKFDTQMLYQKDENTGEASFINPDNPNLPFKTRQEAQQWCDTMNADIDREFKKQVIAQRNELAQQAGPAIRLLQFAPKFDKMSPLEQEYFDDIISGSEVYNNAGEVIGYNVDLDAAAARAKQFASKYGAAAQQQASKAMPTGPAVDMRSSSTAAQGKEDVKEPTNLEEAMKLLKGTGK